MLQLMLEIQMVLNPFITLFPNLGTRSFGTGSSQTLYEKKKKKNEKPNALP